MYTDACTSSPAYKHIYTHTYTQKRKKKQRKEKDSRAGINRGLYFSEDRSRKLMLFLQAKPCQGPKAAPEAWEV